MARNKKRQTNAKTFQPRYVRVLYRNVNQVRSKVMNSKVWSQPTLYIFPPTVLFFTVSSQVKFPLVGEDKRRKAARGLGGLGVGMTTES